MIVHELGHAIGFYHEHSRPDRDEYVEIISSNIRNTSLPHFVKIPSGRSNLLGYGYDHASIMHYDRDAFSRNYFDTIRARDPTIPLGDAKELSPLDIAKANVLYSCGKRIDNYCILVITDDKCSPDRLLDLENLSYQCFNWMLQSSSR